jgi:hypothetical protein
MYRASKSVPSPFFCQNFKVFTFFKIRAEKISGRQEKSVSAGHKKTPRNGGASGIIPGLFVQPVLPLYFSTSVGTGK